MCVLQPSCLCRPRRAVSGEAGPHVCKSCAAGVGEEGGARPNGAEPLSSQAGDCVLRCSLLVGWSAGATTRLPPSLIRWLPQVLVVGFSMGGYVAAAFSAAHPELVAGEWWPVTVWAVTFCAPGPCAPELLAARAGAPVRRVVRHIRRAALPGLLR